MLSKDQLLENKAQLVAKAEQLERDWTATTGAVQNCDYLIELCDEVKEDVVEPEEESPEPA